MRIAWLEPPSLAVQGDQIYRTVQPCRSLADRGGCFVVAGHWLQQVMHEAAETADVLVLCQAVDIDFLPLMARRKRAGLSTLVELNDNFLEPRAFGDVGSFYHHAGHASLVMQLASRADGLLVSTPYLAQLFGGLNDKMLLLPNSIDSDTLPAPSKGTRPPLGSHPAPIRLGWAGSAGHTRDVAAAVPALKTLLARYPQLTLCIMAPAALHPLFAWAPQNRLDLRQATSLQGYLDFIATWDVGLAPLEDTPFNRGRSDVKWLEYTACNVATVASRGPAYHTVVHGETGLLVDGPQDFVEPVAALIDEPELRHTLVARARAEIARHRGHVHTHERLAQFVRALGPVPQSAEVNAAWFARLTAGRQNTQGTHLCYLAPTQAEAQLYAALRAQQEANDRAPMRRLAAALPRCHLPHLYAGAASTDAQAALAHLQVAQRLAPESSAVAHHLTRTHLAAGDTAAAIAVAQAHLRGAPNPYHHAPLWELLATAHGARGAIAAQAQALSQALECNAAYGPPARALAQLLEAGTLLAQDPSLAQQLRPVAIAALHRNLRGHHADAMDALALGRLAAQTGSWPEAMGHFHSALTLAQQQRHEDGIKACLAWLAKGALASGDMAQARAWLLHSRRNSMSSAASA